MYQQNLQQTLSWITRSLGVEGTGIIKRDMRVLDVCTGTGGTNQRSVDIVSLLVIYFSLQSFTGTICFPCDGTGSDAADAGRSQERCRSRKSDQVISFSGCETKSEAVLL